MAAPSSNFSDLGWGLGVCRGVRAFMLTDDGWLTGHYYRQLYLPGVVNTAQCRRDGGYKAFPSKVDSDTRAPMLADESDYPEFTKEHMLECNCGFYAFYNQSNDYNPFSKPNLGLVSGVVEGFGQVLVGPRGFRAQRLMMVALHIPKDYPPQFEEVIQRYSSVPMFSNAYDMVAEFPCEDGTEDNDYATEIG